MLVKNVSRSAAAGILSLVLVGSASIAAFALDVSGITLEFPNPSGDIGDDSPVGTVVTYTGIDSAGSAVIDAKVTVTATSGLDNDDDPLDGCDNVMDYIDEDPSPDSDTALSPQVDVCDGVGSGSATFRVDFFDTGTTDPATLTNLSVLVKDIDSNQFVTVATPTSYALSASPATELRVTTSASTVTFSEPLGNSSSDTDEENWVVMNFDSTNSLTFTIGANEDGSASFDFIFAATTWTNPPTTSTPVYASPDSGETESGETESDVRGPAIALTPLFRLGEQACGRDVLTSGFGLKSGSQQTLTLWQPKTQLSQTVLTGTGFEESTRVPDALSAGTYQLTLSATGQSDQPLDLVRTFTVDSACVVTALDEGKAGSVSSAGLARTGAETPYSLIALTLALLAAGVAAVGASRRIERSSTR